MLLCQARELDDRSRADPVGLALARLSIQAPEANIRKYFTVALLLLFFEQLMSSQEPR